MTFISQSSDFTVLISHVLCQAEFIFKMFIMVVCIFTTMVTCILQVFNIISQNSQKDLCDSVVRGSVKHAGNGRSGMVE